MRKITCLLFLFIAVQLCANDTKITHAGVFTIGGLDFPLVHYSKDWRATIQNTGSVKPDHGFPVSGEASFQLEGEFNQIHFTERIQKVSEREISAVYEFLSPKPTDSKLCVVTNLTITKDSLPGLQFNDTRIDISSEFHEKKFMFAFNEGILRIFSLNGVFEISGFSGCHIQDDRYWNHNRINIRFFGAVNQSNRESICLNVKFTPFAPRFLDLSSAANMGLSDDVSNDGKGGWTDQGQENDMRALKPGTISAGAIQFQVGTPAGKCVLALRGKERPSFPRQISIDLPPDTPAARFLYVLNAVAWEKRGTEAGTLNISYDDGSESSFPFVCGSNTANFWGQKIIPEALLAWKNDNESSRVGLYATAVPLKSRPVRKLVFSSAENSVWLVVALTLANTLSQSNESSSEVVFTEGREWRKISSAGVEFAKGSILDLSDALDAPAGKYGRLEVKGNQFVFENRPDVPVRFWGTNLCFTGAVPPRKFVRSIADGIARNGYNCVRLHHFDEIIANKNDGKGAVKLRADRMDEMDFLVAELKKRGIYITIDLYTIRSIPAGGISGYTQELQGTKYKMLCLIHDAAMDNFKTFAKNLLEHVNPYTGLAYKDDPQLVFIHLLNEDSVFACDPGCNDPALTAMYQKAFEAYCKKKDVPVDKTKFWIGFLAQNYQEKYRALRDWLRKIGVRHPLADQNMLDDFSSNISRVEYDYVDNHVYWCHPEFLEKPWQPPSESQSSESIVSSSMATVAGIATSRLFDRPFTITEWCFVNPNRARAEGGIVLSAFAASQGWNGVFHFAYSDWPRGEIELGNLPGFFCSISDPNGRLSNMIGSLLFLGGGVKENADAYPLVLNSDWSEKAQFISRAPLRYARLSMCGRTGTVVANPEGQALLPAGTRAAIGSNPGNMPGDIPIYSRHEDFTKKLLPKNRFDPEKKTYWSSNEQMSFDVGNGCFAVWTKDMEAFSVGAKQTVQGAEVDVSSEKNLFSIALVAKDGRRLANSNKILIVLMSDTKNTEQRFQNDELRVLKSWGKPPLLGQHAIAKLRFKRELSGFKLYPCDFNGTRKNGPPLALNGKNLVLDNFGFGGDVTAVYELVKEIPE